MKESTRETKRETTRESKRETKREREKKKERARTHAIEYYRVAKTHRMPYLSRSFSAKEPYN